MNSGRLSYCPECRRQREESENPPAPEKPEIDAPEAEKEATSGDSEVLDKLAMQYQQGALTEEEFQRKVSEALNQK